MSSDITNEERLREIEALVLMFNKAQFGFGVANKIITKRVPFLITELRASLEREKSQSAALQIAEEALEFANKLIEPVHPVVAALNPIEIALSKIRAGRESKEVK